MADNALTRLTPIQQFGAAALVFAIIAGLFGYLSYRPTSEEITQKNGTRDTLARNVQALEITAAKLPEFTREVSVLEAKLETLKKILPPEKETPDLMRKVQALAAQSSLTIRKFNPAATAAKDFYQEWPINMEVEGAYHNLGLFFDRVRSLSRLVNIGSIKIGAKQSNPTPTNTINASCVATTFVYVEAPPAAAAAKAAR
jgi:type IV pilus assembly protein PilO